MKSHVSFARRFSGEFGILFIALAVFAAGDAAWAQSTNNPVITCATNRTVECGDSWTFDEPIVTGCDGTNGTVVVVGTTTNTFCGNTFSATRTWQATDPCTNTGTCSQTIIV